MFRVRVNLRCLSGRPDSLAHKDAPTLSFSPTNGADLPRYSGVVVERRRHGTLLDGTLIAKPDTRMPLIIAALDSCTAQCVTQPVLLGLF